MPCNGCEREREKRAIERRKQASETKQRIRQLADQKRAENIQRIKSIPRSER